MDSIYEEFEGEQWGLRLMSSWVHIEAIQVVLSASPCPSFRMGLGLFDKNIPKFWSTEG